MSNLEGKPALGGFAPAPSDSQTINPTAVSDKPDGDENDEYVDEAPDYSAGFPDWPLLCAFVNVLEKGDWTFRNPDDELQKASDPFFTPLCDDVNMLDAFSENTLQEFMNSASVTVKQVRMGSCPDFDKVRDTFLYTFKY